MARLDDAEPVAVDACLAAGGYLRRAHHDGSSEVEYSAVDVNASADVEAETRMLDILEEAFPEHTVDADESGRHPGDDRYRWIVDPLDGTNDFEAGLPSFATAVTSSSTATRRWRRPTCRCPTICMSVAATADFGTHPRPSTATRRRRRRPRRRP